MRAPPPPALVCLGNLTVDDLVLPDGRERPGCVGGDAFYAVLGARLFEPRAEMVAPVGLDLPEGFRTRIEAVGLSAEGLPRREAPTIHNRVAYDADGGRVWTLHTAEGDFHTLSPTPADIPGRWRGAPAFLILAMTLAAQETLVAWLRRETGAYVALDPQEDYIAGNEARLAALVAEVDCFMPSEEEVRRLLGHEDWPRAARELAALGPRLVVIKRGERGALIHDAARDLDLAMPAVAASVVDTTGAGDAFCGAFMANLMTDEGSPASAGRAGAVAASFAVAGYGIDGVLAAGPGAARERLGTLG